MAVSESLTLIDQLDGLAPPDAARFVLDAYLLLLLRPPTADETATALERIADGVPPVEWMRELAGAHAVAIPETIERHERRGRLCRWPILGRALAGAVRRQVTADFALAARLALAERRASALDQRLGAAEELSRRERIDRLAEASATTAAASRSSERLTALEERMAAVERVAAGYEVRLALPRHAGATAVDLDRLYASFENTFRGTREQIRERVGCYLPLMKKASAGTAERPILDIGCGRGEWIELLGAEGLVAEGVDTNPHTVAYCASLGLPVRLGDGLATLEAAAEESLGAVTAFHVVEHMPFAALAQLFSACHKALKTRGLIVFETPNCNNLLVASQSFYLDPTHLRPIPSLTALFLAQFAGFRDCRIIEINPPMLVEGWADAVPEVPGLRRLFEAPLDYALIAEK